MESIALFVLKLPLFPFWLLMRFVEEISGEGRWYRAQKQPMVWKRPPLSDADFLNGGQITQADGPLWLAVRRAMAECCGIPPHAIHPTDEMKDLWRMQWLGPDLSIFVVWLERELQQRIDRKLVWEALGNEIKTLSFSEFAVRVADALKAEKSA